MGFTLVFREAPITDGVEQTLQTIAWGTIGLSLILMGMRLSQLSSWRYFKQVVVSL